MNDTDTAHYKLLNNSKLISLQTTGYYLIIIRPILQASGLRMARVRQLNCNVNCKAHCDFQWWTTNSEMTTV